MNIQEVIKDLDLCFTSGNEVPVSRVTIDREQWELIKEYIQLPVEGYFWMEPVEADADLSKIPPPPEGKWGIRERGHLGTIIEYVKGKWVEIPESRSRIERKQ
jgi:hypothetical protein